MKKNAEHKSTAGTSSRRLSQAQTGSLQTNPEKRLRRLKARALKEAHRLFPAATWFEGCGLLHSGENLNGRVTPAILRQQRVLVLIPLGATAGLLLPLFDLGYAVSGESPGNDVLHVEKTFRTAALARAAFDLLTDEPLRRRAVRT